MYASLIYLIFWELESRCIECDACDADLRCDKHINITYKTYSKSIYYKTTNFFNEFKRLVFFFKKYFLTLVFGLNSFRFPKNPSGFSINIIK